MRSRIRSLAANLGLLFAAVLFAAGGIELVLRAFPQLLPPEPRLRLHWNRLRGSVTLADSYIGFLAPPHLDADGGADETLFHFTTDEHGFRNPTPWPDTAEVVVVGDSEAFGYGAPEDSTWSNILARELPRSRIINLGLPGMGPEQYKRVYERFGVALAPRVLLFGLFPGNDLDDQRDFTAWLRAGSPGNYADWRSSRGTQASLAQRLLERTYLYWLVRGSTRDLSWPIDAEVFDDGTRIRFTPWMLRHSASMAVPGNATFTRILEVIEETRDMASENGTALLVLLFPTKEGVYLPLRGADVPDVLRPFAEALAERGIPYLDLTVPMQAEARKGKRLFFEVDGHPDAAGYRVIAQAVLTDLRQNAASYHLTDWQ